ncbi:GNAT family N-acetyltransferase [Dyella sp.]|uniref:GNAT family N-acetyltransferase n=1 Tax=Dyella sp. TaxID=1869338 RepID=UPI002ED1E0BD
MIISSGHLEDPRVIDLLGFHLRSMHANSPAGNVFALDLSGLKRPDIAFFAAWDGDELLGCGALRELSVTHGEIKSMRTAPAHLRKGAATALLQHMIALAQQRGYERLSLETGSGESFQAAIAMYRRFGFANGAPFGDYVASDFNQFFHLVLTPEGARASSDD